MYTCIYKHDVVRTLCEKVSQDEASRLRVAVVASASPAERAGIEIGDILVTVNGKDASSYSKQ